jgi:hypothetical protein
MLILILTTNSITANAIAPLSMLGIETSGIGSARHRQRGGLGSSRGLIGGRNHAILLIALLPLNAGRTIPAGVAVFSPKWIAPQAHGITVGLVRPQR